jgi:hypothetical protein
VLDRERDRERERERDRDCCNSWRIRGERLNVESMSRRISKYNIYDNFFKNAAKEHFGFSWNSRSKKIIKRFLFSLYIAVLQGPVL